MFAILAALLTATPGAPRLSFGPADDPNAVLRVCNGTCPSTLQGSFGEGLTFTRASAWTCPNDDGTVQQLLSGYPCIPQASGAIEPTTNLLLQSDAWATAPWSTVGNVCAAPTVTNASTDVPLGPGCTAVSKLVFASCAAGGSNRTYAFQSYTGTAVTPYTGSAKFRTASGTANLWIMTTADGVTYRSSPCSIGPNWSTCSESGANSAASWSLQIGFDGRDGTQTSLPAETVYACGGQVEIQQATSPTPVVATTSTAAMGNFHGYGARVRQSTTNLMQFYNALGTAPWNVSSGGTSSNPTVTNNTTDVVAPDGSSTATKIAYPAVSGALSRSFAYQTWTATAAPYSNQLKLRTLSGTATVYLAVTQNNTTYFTTPCSVTSAWSTCTVLNATLSALSWTYQIGVDLRDGAEATQPAQTIYAWGAQAEANSFASDLVPTAGASAASGAETLVSAANVAIGTRPSYSMDFNLPAVQAAGSNLMTYYLGASDRWSMNSNIVANAISCVYVGTGCAPCEVDSSNTYTPGTVGHAACSYDGTSLSIVLNGVKTSAAKSITGSASYPEAIGYYSGDGTHQTGGTEFNVCGGSSPTACQ